MNDHCLHELKIRGGELEFGEKRHNILYNNVFNC